MATQSRVQAASARKPQYIGHGNFDISAAADPSDDSALRRRQLLLASGALLMPFGARSQQAGKPFSIAFLSDLPPAQEPLVRLFARTLQESGRIEGRDFVFYRSGVLYGQDIDRAVRSVVEAKHDLILTNNLGYAIAAHKLTTTIPIVMWASGFPVEGGVAMSLARPGKNVTGLTIYAGAQVFGKVVQLLHDAKPGVKRVGALCTYLPPFHPPEEAELIMQEIRDAGRSLGIEVKILQAARAEQITAALAAGAAERIEALVLTSGIATGSSRQEIMEFAHKRRLPTITDIQWAGVEPQPLMSYGAVRGILFRQAATYVERILWGGAKPGDLPIQLPSKFELIVNLKTAKAIGVTIPPSILLRADEVIE